MTPPPDPRPLLGEPLSLDLLNTVWIDAAGEHDLLDDLAGLRLWLGAHALAAPRTVVTLRALQDARDAVRAHVDDQTGARLEPLNAVLSFGAVRRTLRRAGPEEVLELDRPEHLPAWRAVADYLDLLVADPRRIRRCAHPSCVLHFYDTSPKGTRRWCSMAGCGNRAKAARFYERTRQLPS